MTRFESDFDGFAIYIGRSDFADDNKLVGLSKKSPVPSLRQYGFQV